MSGAEGNEGLRQVLDELVEQRGAKNVALALQRVIDLRQSPDYTRLQDTLAAIPDDEVPTPEQGYDIADQVYRIGMSPVRLPKATVTIEIFEDDRVSQQAS